VKKQKLVDLAEYLHILADAKKSDVILFRGQSSDKPLWPKIARPSPELDTTPVEKEMLKELRRRSDMLLGTSGR
jgi:hypothetical protein